MYFIDTSFDSLTKHGEELCGDHVEQVRLKDSCILVLSDGLGSGVKANILATLTSKIAVTMLKEGSTLEETIDTVVHTLPVCNERHLAYSTFTIVKIYNDGKGYAAEFDNPFIFLIRDGENVPLKRQKKVLNGKTIYECSFDMDENSLLVAVSDGVVHAGVGKSLDLGWQWDNIDEYIKRLNIKFSAEYVTESILNNCRILYENEAGDDTTVLSVKIKEQETINLFTGPPKNPSEDFDVIKEILNAEGKIVVCGGTTANIVARSLGAELDVDISTMTKDLPPVGKIPGIELVTEGVITINKALDIMRDYIVPEKNAAAVKKLKEKNSASMLASMIIQRCGKLNMWIGQAVNPVHQNPQYPMDFHFKMKQLDEFVSIVRQMGKEVNVVYI